MGDNIAVDIFLATYNGAKFLVEQLDSIVNQTHQNWVLYIRDDHSPDNTFEIISSYANRLPNKIHIIKDDLGNLGAKANFINLLQYSKNNYFLFCDQDDIWKLNKVEMEIKLMLQAEKENPGLPILVHTDLTVTNESMEVVAESFWRFQKLNPNIGNNYNKIIALNVVTGCTMIMNKKALEVSLPIPDEATMHDHWIAICTARFGKIVYLNQPTVYYRQHGKNTLGAQKISLVYFLKKIFSIFSYISKYLNIHLKMTGRLPFKVNYFKIFFWKIVLMLSRII